MKLSKKNRTCQNAIRKALAAGKPISGILAGLLSVVTSGCRPRSPADTMGSYPKGRFPDPSYENRRNETNSCQETKKTLPDRTKKDIEDKSDDN